MKIRLSALDRPKYVSDTDLDESPSSEGFLKLDYGGTGG